MLDVRVVRERPDWVRERLASRHGGDERFIDDLLELDRRRRALIAESEGLQAERKRASKEIGALMGQKRFEEAETRKQAVRELGDRIESMQRELKEVEARFEELMSRLPNLPHESVPVGADADGNVVVREWGERRQFDFEPRPHTELCERLGLVDFARGAKLAGSGFLLYTGWGARLERALIQFLLDLHVREHGYTEVSPPFVVGRHCMFGVGQFPKFEDQAYAVQEGLDAETLGRLYLIPTAEAPVANIHREEILAEADLPIRYVAYSPCFRAEAGAAGVGTRGMIRVHQFDKVELIKVVHPDHGYEELESMVADAERVLQRLGLPYRTVLLCTGDMGFAAAKTYDIEVWAPGQGQFLEVSSCSNCEDFQARRMALRFKSAVDGKNRFPHVLNGSGTALARLYVALLENCQQADGRIVIPEPLRPYLGAEVIGP
ncbi:MAG: serine--tRNA ligase [Verrucomicrobia bacterium]|nr:MAG: serine--tRNA ligase [Verrucomicrobiota bacterium]